MREHGDVDAGGEIEDVDAAPDLAAETGRLVEADVGDARAVGRESGTEQGDALRPGQQEPGLLAALQPEVDALRVDGESGHPQVGAGPDAERLRWDRRPGWSGGIGLRGRIGFRSLIGLCGLSRRGGLIRRRRRRGRDLLRGRRRLRGRLGLGSLRGRGGRRGSGGRGSSGCIAARPTAGRQQQRRGQQAGRADRNTRSGVPHRRLPRPRPATSPAMASRLTAAMPSTAVCSPDSASSSTTTAGRGGGGAPAPAPGSAAAEPSG